MKVDHLPRALTKPFVVVFTDIESSSLLWGRDATEMARCLQTRPGPLALFLPLTKYFSFEFISICCHFSQTLKPHVKGEGDFSLNTTPFHAD